ncbi:Nucleus export protein brr6 [Colletotrichum sidae]|uniref:Nucleus export protein brr6 n=1 Tax=Colletotrichum sidae TaxID=1347389 RepID=A0A4V3I1M5_9PEZI|nr:Nucleus export protein brr6 [Colletotrichum sidae]
MDRRTFESPMEWEYEAEGPLDATSPFSQVAKGNTKNIFSTPGKFSSSGPNPFANSPSKPNLFANSSLKPLAALPPQISLFSPRIQSKNTAPPFRNPAFTTPRKPFDSPAFSEASGMDSSPALTETSEIPDDTPDADRYGDVGTNTMSPSKVDKSHRYGKAGLQSAKRHVPGRGEIARGARDYPAIRKRKRHNLDRDVGGSLRYHGSQDWDSECESERDAARPRSRSKGGKKVYGRNWISNLFHTLEEHPNAPENLYRWIQLLVNCILVSSFVFFCWAILDTVRTDIRNANEAARQEIESRMAECRSEYQLNECAKKDRPALKAMCDEWYECMIQDPTAIMRVRVTVKQIAEILNEFAGAMQVKAWVFFFGILLICIVANNLTLGRLANSASADAKAPAHRAPSGVAPEPSIIPEPSQAYMWVPIQTPSHRRHIRYDSDATDTDASPPKPMSIMPPRTPSGRRSPSKGDRDRLRSPVKYGLSPVKGY